MAEKRMVVRPVWTALARASLMVLVLAILGYLDSQTLISTESLLYGLFCYASVLFWGVNWGLGALAGSLFTHFASNHEFGWQPETTLQSLNMVGLLGLVVWSAWRIRLNWRLLRETSDSAVRAHQQLLQHLQTAHEVQSQLLGHPPARLGAFHLLVQYHVAMELGGDVYSVSETKAGLFLFVGDVSGKGPRAALAGTAVRATVGLLAPLEIRPENVLQRLQREFLEMFPDGMFVTAWCAYLDSEARTLTYSNAGHDPPLLRRGNGEVVELTCGNLPVGIDAAEAFQSRVEFFQPGDVLLVYTDGLVDARQPGGERLGIEAVEELLRASLSPAQLADELSVRSKPPQPDDVMVLLCAFDTVESSRTSEPESSEPFSKIA